MPGEISTRVDRTRNKSFNLKQITHITTVEFVYAVHVFASHILSATLGLQTQSNWRFSGSQVLSGCLNYSILCLCFTSAPVPWSLNIWCVATDHSFTFTASLSSAAFWRNDHRYEGIRPSSNTEHNNNTHDTDSTVFIVCRRLVGTGVNTPLLYFLDT